MSIALKKLYDDKFYDEQRSGSLLAAKTILPLIFQIYTPNSVIDVGCGIGTWLAAFKELVQNARVLGLDGEYNKGRLLIAADEFIGCNLEDPLPSFSSKFDLVISLEVAEHLSSERAFSFVKELTELGDIVLFSAACPGQGGKNHVNEQWHEYWIKLFEEEKFFTVDWIRPQIMNYLDIPAHYRSNILLFVCKEFSLKIDCGKYKNFKWTDIQRMCWVYALQPRFFERLGTKLDDNAGLTALKKIFKKLHPKENH